MSFSTFTWVGTGTMGMDTDMGGMDMGTDRMGHMSAIITVVPQAVLPG